jgi:hypothetical protein
LREILASHNDSALHEDDLTIDTSYFSSEEAAWAIQAHIARLTR